MIERLRSIFSPEERRVIGAEAKQALDNKHWREAFDAMESYLIDSAKSARDAQAAHLVAISLQLLEGIKQELIRKIEDGEVAKMELEQVERANRPRMFQR